MAHNFIWTSNDVENCPDCLRIGIEIEDSSAKVYCIDPTREEFFMGEQSLNNDMDLSQISADWFHSEMANDDNGAIWLMVNMYNPANDKPDDQDYIPMTHLQMMPDGDRYLKFNIIQDYINPMILDYFKHH